MTGAIDSFVGVVPRISATLDAADHWGCFKARWGVGRMHYTVEPGLYGLGNPGEQSPVLVTANYKMSFDRLRRVLDGRNAWILVLDTEGINVWCAAGKGSFGTGELTARLDACRLAEVVRHRDLILPQLGAPGVAAHEVKKETGFRVHYGPVEASDLPAFLDKGYEATPAMRRKTFPLKERAVLIPVELVGSLKSTLVILPLLLFLGGLGGPDNYWANALHSGLFAMLAYGVAIIAGTALTPLFLPLLPGRAFAVKGMSAGLAAAILLIFAWGNGASGLSGLEIFAVLLAVPAVASYWGMNFTGASTYTSLSGVKKEMRWGLPLQVAAGLIGLASWLVSRFMV